MNKNISIDNITKEDIERVETMSAWGATLKMIAAEMNICERTFRNWREKNPELDAAYKRGREEGSNRLLNTAYKQAMDGNTAVLIFLLKTRLGMSERPVIDMSSAKLNKIIDIIINTVKDPDELKEIESKMRQEIDVNDDGDN